MTIYRIDPLHDSRWEEFLQQHPRASIFHTRAWLRTLRTTYGYEPLAFVTSPAGAALTNAIACSRIMSVLTGTRLVSMPFADHCDPLISNQDDLNDLLSHIEQTLASEGCRYFEVRSLSGTSTDLAQCAGLATSANFIHHVVNLQPNFETLFRSLHKSCIQRKIRRAEREGLVYEEGSSDEVVKQFYRLLVLTRRRHGLPPQPLAWFSNLRDSFGTAFKVRTIYKKRLPIASIPTLRYKDCLVYKYGASDHRFHNLGAMPFLFWRTMELAKALSLSEFDLGRSDRWDQGLIAFKDHLGASSTTLTYCRYPAKFATVHRAKKIMPLVCAHLPPALLRLLGGILYRHIG